jgi:hypothetical protein
MEVLMGSSPAISAPEPYDCLICGMPDAPALYVAPLCPVCARRASLELDTDSEATELCLVIDGRRICLARTRGPIAPAQETWWAALKATRAERLAVIASGYASPDDPDFLASLPGYLAEVGESAFSAAALRRQAQRKQDRRARDVALAARLAELADPWHW